MKNLSNKVVLITGGSKGLGFVLAKHLIKEKCKIALCARSLKELKVARDELRAIGGDPFISVCDVSNRKAVDNLISEVIKHFGQIDILVNDAGVIMVAPMESYPLHKYHEAMDIMFWGTVNTTLAVLPYMKNKKTGQVINITSVGGMVSIPHLLPYTASKFAAVGFSQGITAELRKDNIYVSTIVPGLMRTGSYVNAFFQENNKNEFKLFSMMSTAPILTISADKAARETIRAIKNRTVLKVLGLPAKVLIELNHFFPETTLKFLSLVSRFLPAATRQTGFEQGLSIRKKFKDAELPVFEQIGKKVQEKHQPSLH
jgi:short-subunit dehydrogenase